MSPVPMRGGASRNASVRLMLCAPESPRDRGGQLVLGEAPSSPLSRTLVDGAHAGPSTALDTVNATADAVAKLRTQW